MQMEKLTACPACGNRSVRELHRNNDLTHFGNGVDENWKRSDFCLCPSCGLLYASWRQAVAEADGYYERFAELEHRTYACHYPPPDEYLQNKAKAARRDAELLESLRLLEGTPSVLHLRCDAGMLLDYLRGNYGLMELYGLDYFASNIRYAREHLRLSNVDRLSAGVFRHPFAVPGFDLIVANHQVTHALDPRSCLAALRGALNADGRVFFYNEVDHDGAFPYARGVNNYHKQLLTEASFSNLLRLAGFEIEWFDRRKPYFLAVGKKAEPCRSEDLPLRDYTSLEHSFCEWAQRMDRTLFWQRVYSRVPLRTAVHRYARGVKRLLRSALRPASTPSKH